MDGKWVWDKMNGKGFP